MKLKYSDRVHGYWLDGRRCTSVTAIAKIPDSTFGLDSWRKRQVALGLAREPGLVESVAAHHTDTNKLDELCEQAMAAAGAWEAAERGTAAHRVTERVDRGEDMIETPTSRIIADVWARLLDAAGLEVVPEMVERVVVYPEQLICGKFDRFFRRKKDGRLVVGDLKTGDGAVRYPHSVSVQLAAYANAPLLAGRWDGIDGETETFEPLNDVDRDVGYIIFLPGEGRAQVIPVDIAAGYETLQQIIFPILRWRQRKDLLRDSIASVEVPTTDPLETQRLDLAASVKRLSPRAQRELRQHWPYPGLTVRSAKGWDGDKLAHVAGMVRVLTTFSDASVGV